MLENLFKHSLRSFKNQRPYIFINITGLSIGIACSLLIALYILSEVTYDRFNFKRDRIYNIVTDIRLGDNRSGTEAITPARLGSEILREFPEVENVLRMKRMHNEFWEQETRLTYNNQTYTEENIIEADSSFFDFFTIPVLRGDPGNLLNAPGKIVLSVSVANKIFGNQNPVDKILKIGKDSLAYVVTGVMDDIPGNSHFKAGVLVSMLSDHLSYNLDWDNGQLNTYLLLKPKSDYGSVNKKLKLLTVKHHGPLIQQFYNLSFDEFLAMGYKYEYYLQKLTDIHFDTSVVPHFLPTGNPKLLEILSGIALLILLVAAVNFTNLSTAQASNRSKEVAIKKLSGSTRFMLRAQFLTESIIMSSASTVIALFVIKIILPFFNDLLGTNLTLNLTATWYMIPFIVLFSVITGIIAGSYPSFFLSSFSPYRVLKGGKDNNSNKGKLRKVLVVLQFTISIFLIVVTLIMNRQIIYMLKRDPGFNNAQLLVLENEEELEANARSFKETIAMIPGVINITSSMSVPGNSNMSSTFTLEGKIDETLPMCLYYVDYNFMQTYGMELQSGRFFIKEFFSDTQACLLNETAIKKFNIDPGNMRIGQYHGPGKLDYYPIIGIVKDFIFESQRNQIAPCIIMLKPERKRPKFITVKISPQNHNETIGKIVAAWKEFTTDEPIKYTFVEDIMKQLYIKDRQNAIIAVISSILAIIIAALGLYGLNSYTVEHRTKEIGLRKAMGSTIPAICFQISRETLILLAISVLLSFPVIYFVSVIWLEEFYYRISPDIITFLGGMFFAVLIALLTISYHTIKAANANPALSLRYE
jgi:putative ABC transport system permease protein